MSDKMEQKFSDLNELVISTAERYNPLAMKRGYKINGYKALQIILATSTTILLGLKLGGISTSLAFIFSTLSSALTIWFSIESKSKEYSCIFKYSTYLVSLAREIHFYIKTANTLEEEKFLEYSNRFFNLKNEFEKETISLVDESLKKDKDTIKNLK